MDIDIEFTPSYQYPHTLTAGCQEAEDCMQRILNYGFVEFELEISIPMMMGGYNTKLAFTATLNSTPEQYTKFRKRVSDFINSELNLIRNGY